jgi:uncharacterized membrane protein
MLKFVKTTMAGGVVFILPLMLVFILLEKALRLLHGAIVNLLPMFSTYSVAGITLLSLIALFLLVFVCFVAGLLARTQLASGFIRTIESKVLGNLPGYDLLKDAAARFAGIKDVEGAQVGLICEDDGWLFCLVVEAEINGWISVYVPSAGPSGATGGDLKVMPAHLVRMTELAWLPVLACLRRGGKGALELAVPWLPQDAVTGR